ncbi:MAG: type II toxin-antitoxin system RelE/ParE family toxin [Rhizomicrobium sp.]
MPRWTPPAISDLQEAWAFVAADNEAAADRQVAIVNVAANRLDRFPRLGRPMPTKDTRQFFVSRTPFKLLYRILTYDEVEILRVYHTAREWPP